MIEIRKKENEAPSSLLYRFTKKVQQGGVLKEAKSRRFRHRPENRLKRKLGAIYRFQKQEEVKKAKKLGTL